MRKLTLIIVALFLAAPAADAGVPTAIDITNFVFSPRIARFATAGIGVNVTNNDNEMHTVTSVLENSGTPASDTVIPATTTTSTIFATAGTWTYYCAPHPNMKRAKVQVNIDRGSPVRTVGDIVSIYFGQPGAGYDVDVQIKRPRTKRFKTLAVNETDDTVAFQVTKTGLYRFRARTQNTTTGQATAFSPASTVQVYS